jgi:hypothetical protein
VATELGGEHSLIFSGADQRYAITKDMDLTAGGFLSASMLLAPEGWDTSNPLCATNYDGPVDVQYSVDGGTKWVDLYRYVPSAWRSTKFFDILFEIPDNGRTTHTRFRFNQPAFQESVDFWAIDNVRVLRYLPQDWRTSEQSLDHIADGKVGVQTAQCCFDTDWCQHRLTEAEMDTCKSYPWFTERRYLMRGAELILALTLLIGILKFCYVSVQDYLIQHILPFQSEIDELLGYCTYFYRFLPARYRPKRNINKYLTDIHALARLDVAMREHLGEEEGQGKRVKKKEEIKAEKEVHKSKKLKIRDKHIEKRNRLAAMKSNKYAADHIAELDKIVEEHDNDLEQMIRRHEEEEKDPEVDPEQFGKDKLVDDIERLKRQNLAALRQPFEMRTDYVWICSFYACTMGSLVILLLYQMSTSKYYSLYETLNTANLQKQPILFNSYLFNVFALFCDFKEIYYCAKYVVPVRKRWQFKVSLSV